MAWRNTEWLDQLGNDTKVAKPRFGMSTEVPTEDSDLEGDKNQGIETIVMENELIEKGFQVEDVAWRY